MRKRFSPAFVLGIALTCSIHLPAPCLAQQSELNADASGCPNLAIFPKLAGSVVVSCQNADSVEVTMPLKPDSQGFAREKSVRGVYEYREYQIAQSDQEHAFDNLIQLAPMAGFTVKYSSSPSTITARNGDTWVLINVSGEFYNVSVVRAKEEPWAPPFKNAQEISQEMDAHSRVAIYGIEFSPGNQAISESDSKILTEVLKYLQENTNLAVIVESHKFSTDGKAEDDLEITRKRASAVVDWLVAHGIAAGRLQSKALGRTKPVTENDTPIEIQRNDRITLAKAAS
jgi:outer membrane protein OmpA-like peptidoglycan-associated protein